MSDQGSKKRNLAVVAIIMNNDGKVLLTQRHQPGSHHAHGKWQFAGGGIQHGEHPVDALTREIEEEVGLTDFELLSDTPFLYSNYFETVDTHAIILGFPVMYRSGMIDITADPETGAAQWYNVEEVEHLDSLPGTTELVRRALSYLEGYPVMSGLTEE